MLEETKKSIEQVKLEQKDEDSTKALESMIKEFGNELEQNPEIEQGLNQLFDALFSQEMLQQPFNEIVQKYHEILNGSEHNLTQEQRQRYEAQLKVYEQLKSEMDKPEGQSNREKVIFLMNELQDLGEMERIKLI